MQLASALPLPVSTTVTWFSLSYRLQQQRHYSVFKTLQHGLFLVFVRATTSQTALIQLHWLPITFRIRFKTALFMCMVHTNHTSTYISQALSTAANNPSRQSLRSANSTDYVIPRTRAKFGERAFTVSGPAIRNSLTESLRLLSSTSFSNLV
jgi:hypothetical protein